MNSTNPYMDRNKVTHSFDYKYKALLLKRSSVINSKISVPMIFTIQIPYFTQMKIQCVVK
jgi:hypothetical protein